MGLFNNTEREAQFKHNFIAPVPRSAAGKALPPRSLFKFGSWHMYRGRSPGGAFTIGNFAHELAIFGGLDAYGLAGTPRVDAKWSELDAWMKPLLPATPAGPADSRSTCAPSGPTSGCIGSRWQRKDQWQLRDLINAFDALVILPEGPEAEWTLTGFPKLGG